MPYTFLYCSVGANGRQSDVPVLQSSQFYRNLRQDKLNFPRNETLAGLEMQYAFLEDQGYALEKNIVVPYQPTIWLLCQLESIEFCQVRVGWSNAHGDT